MSDVGLRHERVLSHGIYRLEMPTESSISKFSHRKPWLVRKSDAPCLFEFLSGSGIGYFLITRINIGKSSHIAGSLNVCLSPQRIDAVSFSSNMASDKGKVCDAEHIVRTDRMLGDAHRIENRRIESRSIHDSSFLNQCLVDASQPGDHIKVILRNNLYELLISFCVRLDKLFVDKPLVHHDLHHAIEKCHVDAWEVLNVDVSNLCKVGLPWITDNKLCATLLLVLFHKLRNHGVAFCHVRAYDKHYVRILDVVNRIRRCTRAKRLT